MKVPSLNPRSWKFVPGGRGRRAPIVWVWMAGLLVAGTLPAGAGGPKGATGPLTIPANALGYQPMPALFSAEGGTEFTLNFVDETHLLFTFGVRTLLSRLPDATPDDQDRNVAAVLLELPTGKVLARTQWRTRDHDKYLWELGHGRFLLRVRSRLTVIDPLENLAEHGPEDAFRQQELASLKRPIGYISVSPAGDLLGIETVPPRKPKLIGGAASAAALAATVPGASAEPEMEDRDRDGRPPVQILFFRLVQGQTKEGKPRLSVRSAGIIGAPNLIELPATGEGFLEISQDKQTQRGWLFDFVAHTGKRVELSGYETSCAPRPFWISKSEFVAFGCAGSSDRQEFSYFNLKGDEPWLQMLHGTHVSPSITAAPAAGRLALSRTLLNGTIFDAQELTPDLLQAQEITVMQAYDGRTLLKVQATPIQRAGQNFDLSPDGMQFAVFRGGNLEVYRLPALTGKDEKELKLAEEMAPEPNTAEVKLNAQPVKYTGGHESEAPAEAKSDAEGASTPTAAAPPAEVGTAAAAARQITASASTRQPEVHVIQNGDAEAEEPGQRGPRKAPSLYSTDHPKSPDDAAPSSSPGKPY